MRQGAVEFWLDRRLPFEPKGDYIAARRSPRAAIQSLSSSPSDILAATYTSLETAGCDVENVLLYNVGCSAFASTTRKGVQFVRSCAAPPPSPSGKSYLHHHRYEIVPWCGVTAPENACEFSFPLERISAGTKAHNVWWAAASADTVPSAPILGPFVLEVQLPTTSVVGNLSGVVKPLVDGVICALHSDSRVAQDAVLRLAALTGWSADEIMQRLNAPRNPLLGSRPLLRSYRGFVKWNPADDLCHRGLVAIRDDASRICTVSCYGVAAGLSQKDVLPPPYSTSRSSGNPTRPAKSGQSA